MLAMCMVLRGDISTVAGWFRERDNTKDEKKIMKNREGKGRRWVRTSIEKGVE